MKTASITALYCSFSYAGYAIAQPISSGSLPWYWMYGDDTWDGGMFGLPRPVSEEGDSTYCFTDFPYITDGPTAAQMLAIFSSNVIEDGNGRVFAVNSDVIFEDTEAGYSGGFPEIAYMKERKGLYEVIDKGDGQCVQYRLLMEVDDIGQIVYAGNWANVRPIEIVAVVGNGEIWGFYQDSSGNWNKKQTAWGDARAGTLAEMTNRDGSNTIIGLSKDGRRFSLYGDFENFNYARSADYCSSQPAGLGDWSGKWSQFRGEYCPAADDQQLIKRTWHGSPRGPETSNLMWEPGMSLLIQEHLHLCATWLTRCALFLLCIVLMSKHGKSLVSPLS